MKASCFITGFLFICFPLFSQQEKVKSTVPNLEITEISLADQNGNKTIEANETCNLQFKITNSGGRTANGVKIKLSHSSVEHIDIEYRKSRSLLVVKNDSYKEVTIPIIAGIQVPEGLVEFQIEAIEPNGFDAYPIKIEINTARGDFFQEASVEQQQPEPELLDLSDTSTLIIKDLQFKDHNQNDELEAYETSHIQFRLYNLGDNDVKNINVHIQQTEKNISGIAYPKMLKLGYYPSYYMQDISIPVKGGKNLTGGLAGFSIYMSEDEGLESNHQLINVNTRRYEKPQLKILFAEFSPEEGKEIQLDQPFNLNLAIKNEGTGTAYRVESTLRILYEDVKLVSSKPKVSVEEIQGGETHMLSYQMIANKNYFLPELPVILEVTENNSNLFLDTMLMTTIFSPEKEKEKEKEQEKEREVVADVIPETDSKAKASTQPEPKKTTAPIVLPDLELYGQQFIDDNNNNVIDVEESSMIKLKVRNSGRGAAEDVSVQISQLNAQIEGLKFPDNINLGDLVPGTEKEVIIPIRSPEALPSDKAEFRIDLRESRGLDALPLVLQVKTEKRLEPGLSISLADFMDETGQLRRNYPIELKIAVTNQGPGSASDLQVQFELPDQNCVLLGETDLFNLDILNSGESRDFSLLFTATRRYTADEIPIKVEITESFRKFGIDTILIGNLNKETQALRTHTVEPRIIEQQVEPPVTEPQVEPPVTEPQVEPLVTVPPVEPPVTESRGGGDPMKGLAYEEAIKEMKIGRYFALIIGIDDYTGKWHSLKNAVRDAQSVEEILKTKYKFDHFRALYNDMATRENIIRELEWLVRNVTPDDNILIFFSGHGEFKQELNRGYWIPVEAQTNSTFDYISNSVIRDFLSSINSKHTLLISDACFSGDIFRGNTISIPFERSERYYRTVHTKSSRQAITSGGIEPVMDGGRDGHSVFTYYLLKSLETNEDTFFDASQLYNDLKISVFNNSNQSPEFQHLKNTGDEGGQFIFIQK